MTPGDLASSTTAEAVDAMDQLHGLAMATHAQLLALVGDYDRRQAWKEDGATAMADWLVARYGMAWGTASEWVRVAHVLESCPTLAARVNEGRLSFDQLCPLATLCAEDPGAETDLVEQTEGYSAAQLRRLARRSRRPTNDDANEVHRRRCLTWRPTGSYLRISGRLAPEAGAVVAKALFRLAEGAPKDPATGAYDPFESRCADALVGLCSTALTEDAGADRATVVIHAPLSALVGGEGAGEAEDGCLLAPETLRRLACDGRIGAVAEGPDGTVVGVGRTTRVVPAWLARQVRRRDQGCRFPGCRRRRWAHSHHLAYWGDGGSTDLENLVTLCHYHHRRVHEEGWRVEGAPAGELVFVTPGGRVFASRAPALRPEVRRRLPDSGGPEPVSPDLADTG